MITTQNDEEFKECVVCGKESSYSLCYSCVRMTKDYNDLKEYVNGLEEVNENLVYLLSFGINDRYSSIVNNVNVTTELVIGDREEKVSGEIDGCEIGEDNVVVGIKTILKPKEKLKNSTYILKRIWEIEELRNGKKMIVDMLKGKR